MRIKQTSAFVEIEQLIFPRLPQLIELNFLEISYVFEIYPVSSQIVRKSVPTLLEHHVSVADAVQLETCV